jgi:prepilin-type N-terminal cleavage/methylation domain-containing protein
MEYVMQRIVLQNKTGFTLIEVLIALVVSLMVFLALMQTALVGVDSTTRGNMRDEAVGIAAGRMDEVRALPFAASGGSPGVVSDTGSLSDCDCPDAPTFPYTAGKCVKRNFKNISQFNFCTNVSCIELGGSGDCTVNDANIKQVTITVGWKWKGVPYSHIIKTVRKSP